MKLLVKFILGAILILALLGCVDTTGVYERCSPETEQHMDVYDVANDTIYEDLWYVLP